MAIMPIPSPSFRQNPTGIIRMIWLDFTALIRHWLFAQPARTARCEIL
jgi:hypothetical protein